MHGAAGVAADDEKGVGIAVVDRRFIRGFGESPEAGFFQELCPGVAGCYKVDPGDDVADGPVSEQGADDGPQGSAIEVIVGGGVKTIDTDSPGLGQVIGGEVHLDGRVHFEQEEEAVVIKYEVGAKGLVGLHAVINLPQSFIGIELGAGAIEFVAKEFANNPPVRVFTDRPEDKVSPDQR